MAISNPALVALTVAAILALAFATLGHAKGFTWTPAAPESGDVQQGRRLEGAAVEGLGAQLSALQRESQSGEVVESLKRAVEELQGLAEAVAQLSQSASAAAAGAASTPLAAQQQQDLAALAGLAPEDQLNVERCRDSCCWAYRPIEWAYSGEKGRLPTMRDRLSPADVRTIIDLHHDVEGGSRPAWLNLTFLSEAILPCLQPGTVIMVEGWQKASFVQQFLPKIHVPFVLINGDGDHDNPEPFKDLMEDSRLLHYYAFNCDVEGSWAHEHFTCFPLGLSQWNEQREKLAAAVEAGAGLAEGRYLRPAAKLSDKPFLVSFSFNPEADDVSTHARAETMAAFCNGTLAPHSEPCGSSKPEEFYDLVGSHMFTVSPRGMGLDCYRNWEVLYAGGFLLVKRSSIDELFTGLPVWIVDTWEEVTPKSAQQVYRTFAAKQWSYERLYLGWWQRQIYGHRPGLIKAKRIEYWAKGL